MGEVDRKALAREAYPNRLSELNAVTHPFVVEEVDRRIAAARQEGRSVAIDAIALIESGLAQRCDAVVAVLAPRELRLRRIMARDGSSEDYARARIESQQPDEFYKQNCDKILENAGTPEAFAAQCKQYFTEVLQHGKRKED